MHKFSVLSHVVLGLVPVHFSYHQTSNISSTLVDNKIVDRSDVVGASTVKGAPNTSSFLTEHLASIDCVKTMARQDKKHLSFGIWCTLYKRFDDISFRVTSLALRQSCDYLTTSDCKILSFILLHSIVWSFMLVKWHWSWHLFWFRRDVSFNVSLPTLNFKLIEC